MRDEEIITGEITEFIKKHQQIQDVTQTVLVSELNMPKAKVSRAIGILKKKGVVEVSKKGKFNILKVIFTYLRLSIKKVSMCLAHSTSSSVQSSRFKMSIIMWQFFLA